MNKPFNHFLNATGFALWLWLSCALAEHSPAQEPGSKPHKIKKSAKAPPSEAPDPTNDLFAGMQVPRLEIEIPEAGLDRLREYSWGGRGGNASERPSVKATVREGTQVYRDVAVHLKGSAGSFRPVDDRPALTLNFDKYTKHQTFHGLERLSLNNSIQDSSFLSEQICRELFAAAGVPVPRAAHAQVKLNGRNLGLYVMLEAYNKQFLRRTFHNDRGNLYDGGFVKEITDDLEKSSGENPNDRSDLERLARAAEEPNLTTRFSRLDQVLHIDRFLSYLAIDVMTCNGDGYALNRNNYRIYHDPVSDRLVFMPHGLDQMFGTFRSSTDLPMIPKMNGLVARSLLQTPEGRRRYRERFAQLYTNVFRIEILTNRLQELATKIGPIVEAESARRAAYFGREVEGLMIRIADRARNLQDQIQTPNPTLAFDPQGMAPLTQWKSRLEYGKPTADELTNPGNPPTLHLSANQGSSVGVWSTKVLLEPGSYRLEGRAKCQGVTPEPGDRKGGAGLRTNNRRFVQKLTGDSDWTELSFDFELDDEGDDPVELRCELRAIKGEVWFDRNSLRLRKK